MNTITRVLLAAGFAAAVAGCQQQQNNDATGAAVRDVPAAAVSSATTAEPAKVPANDPSLPPYGTAPQEASTATGSQGASATDSSHSTLTAGERDRALPLEGQVNNYSSDAFAKRGDSNVEHTQQGPRGNEAVATPNSYPKEPK